MVERERERDAARLSERSKGELSGETSGALSCFPWLWGRSCSRTLKVRKGVDIWVHKPKLERKDGKPVCVPRAHRQRRGGAAAGPGRQGWMLPGPQQWFGAGRLLSVCAVSLNPERVTHFLTLELQKHKFTQFLLLPWLHFGCRIRWIENVTQRKGETWLRLMRPSVGSISAACSNEPQNVLLYLALQPMVPDCLDVKDPWPKLCHFVCRCHGYVYTYRLYKDHGGSWAADVSRFIVFSFAGVRPSHKLRLLLHRAQAHSHMCRVRRNGCPKTGKRVFCLTAGLMGEVMQLNTEDWQMSRDVNTQRHLKSASPTDSRVCCCCQLVFLPSLLSARFPTFKDISSCAQRCAFHWSSVIISHFNDQSWDNAEGGEKSAFLQGSLAFNESFHHIIRNKISPLSYSMIDHMVGKQIDSFKSGPIG